MTQIVKIGDISTQIRGVSYSKSDAILNKQDGYLPVLRANNIQEQGLVLEDFVYVPEGKISEKQRILAGDVIIAASSGSISLVGKAASAKEDINAGFGAFCKILRPNTELVDPRYFANYFQTKKYRQIISNLAAGANINNLKNEHLDDLEILLPPLEEQRRIASILDKADELRQKRQQAIEKLDQLLQAAFIDMFGDPVSNPKGWNNCKFENVIEFVTYGLTVRPEYHEQGIPLISAREIRTGELNYDSSPKISKVDFEKLSEKAKPKQNDILFSKTGSIGHCAIVKDQRDFAVTQNAARVVPRVDVCNPMFLLYFMRTKYFYNLANKEAKGNAVKDLQLGIMKSFQVYLPPMDLQDKWAIFAALIEKQKNKLETSNEEVSNLFKSLQNQAFNGTL